ncbi:hypothetical protein EMIHUDRAFT_205420 [Emiliania huxleyi CCMP1516]|uniref:C3H1-type domain-containing protein n=2 Tax=Emiliania huxleyi TaxID=2903 RepID=A0A0D3JSB5_EMIH1|nr:hypothetical protein EMIHUDRAFT_246768 [Emiliania huxleyi CCMP1516]XP_005778829.1 hypothetical protein EMIHUDRAFT_205420 [Emiliania huxleyi CCMP1516]EOD13632.1 hypothetical protein EMIHUDRAFT_246768 [Emiliania huxleyi CCMP1516]EOD26400.1 hypothetical protein EMIHUDRAFT_205420 [Emiliania huxleyi CCMP1516]|eukprot:XP_005766061.1 hypothetical protein EMIHUDRAFT_246768 [Emiliania huxleyi CCMP1516]
MADLQAELSTLGSNRKREELAADDGLSKRARIDADPASDAHTASTIEGGAEPEAGAPPKIDAAAPTAVPPASGNGAEAPAAAAPEAAAPLPAPHVAAPNAQSQQTAQVCKDFQNGLCNRGASCKFSHEQGHAERDSAAGMCSRGASCRFRHEAEGGAAGGAQQCGPGMQGGAPPSSDQPRCLDFLSGRCTRGDSCRFSHAAQ